MASSEKHRHLVASTEQADTSARSERFAYMADLLDELKTMAEAEGCETLSGLLALARAEALAKATPGRDR